MGPSCAFFIGSGPVARAILVHILEIKVQDAGVGCADDTVLWKFMVEHEHGIADFHFSVRHMGQLTG
jgi:hypothetical protein